MKYIILCQRKGEECVAALCATDDKAFNILTFDTIEAAQEAVRNSDIDLEDYWIQKIQPPNVQDQGAGK
jgi:hypothetical protein